jgi:hypothetical protein
VIEKGTLQHSKQWWWFCSFHWTATEEEYASSMLQM